MGFIPYEINRRNNDNSIKFEKIALGNPRVSFKFKDVSYGEAEVLRKTMRDYSSRLANPGNLSAYYELIEGSFSLNFEGMEILESKDAVDYIVKNSWLSTR